MDRTTVEDALFPACPIRNILARLCDKWSLVVIYTLNQSLTVTLRTLEEDGYVTRTVFPEVPPRVEYALTERSKSLLPYINALIKWALDHKEEIMKDRKKSLSLHALPTKTPRKVV